MLLQRFALGVACILSAIKSTYPKKQNQLGITAYLLATSDLTGGRVLEHFFIMLVMPILHILAYSREPLFLPPFYPGQRDVMTTSAVSRRRHRS